MEAVILAAGLGERLKPLTENKPKSLLPIANRPIIDYIIEKLKSLEKIEEIIVVAGYRKEKLEEYLKGKNVKIIEEKEQRGTAHALFQARNFVRDRFLVIYGDLFFEDDLKNFLNTNRVLIGVVEVNDVSRFGKVEVKEGKLIGIREKSERGKGMINAGVYAFYPDIFDAIEKTEISIRGEYELTDSIMKLKKDVYVQKLEGFWCDIGYPWDYLRANMYMLNKIGFSIGKNTKIWSSAIIKKPVIIGDNCIIKNSVIESSIIGNNCFIGEFSVIRKSIVMNNSNISSFNHLSDSIIGENVVLEEGIKTANSLFSNKKNSKVSLKEETVDKMDNKEIKFGAIIGDSAKIGVNVSINFGRKIGYNSSIDANVLVNEDIPSNVHVKLQQKISILEKKEE